MIDERLEEQASLYALGCLTGEEQRAFETALRDDAELRQLVAALSLTTAALAGTVPQAEPPPALKAKILARIDQQEKVVPLPSPAKSPNPLAFWVPWAIAACLMVLLLVKSSHESDLNSRLAANATALQEARTENANSARSLAEMKQLAQTLQQTTNDLHQTILALQETNRIANLRVAMLSSLLEDQPKAVAVSLWDEKNQNGVFVVQNLKPLPKDKDYQLWVIDPQYGTPVDAGVFQVDAAGNVRFQFKAKQLIKTANKFAVTQEDKGGSPTPKGQMVLIGG